MSRDVTTPGIGKRPPSSLLAQRGDMIGVVMELTSHATDAPRWTDCPTCSVLLLSSLHEIHGVLIAEDVGGVDGHASWTPDETDPELRERVRSSVDALPSLASGADADLGQWGSRVLVTWNSDGIPIIVRALQHPGRSVADVKDTPGGIADGMTGASTGWKPDGGVDLPPEISSAHMPAHEMQIPPDVAVDEVSSKLYTYFWGEGWLQGAQNAYLQREVQHKAPDVEKDPDEALINKAYDAGATNGEAYGKRIRIEKPPETTEPPPIDWTQPRDESSAVQEGENRVPATDKGPRVYSIARFGKRIVLQDGGDLIIDTSAGGVLRLQAGPEGVILSTGSGKLELKDGGATMVAKAATIVLEGDVYAGGAGGDTLPKATPYLAWAGKVCTALGKLGQTVDPPTGSDTTTKTRAQ